MQSPEAAIVQQFEEVKRHKPSVIYIPNVNVWYYTLSDSAIRTFTGLLRSLSPTEPVLLLGVLETGPEKEDKETKELNARMMRDLFGYSLKSQYELERPDRPAREEYFEAIIDYIRKAPIEFPDAENRKRRKLPELPVAPAPETPTGLDKADLKAQKRRDRQTLNLLKLHIQSVMDQIKLKYKKFRTPVVDDRDIKYLYDEQNPDMLTTDLGEEQRQQQQLFRPYELDKDERGVPGLREVASGKFYYNLEIVTIEKRLSNGYYKRPKDFLADIKRLAKDAKASGDQDRTLKANEMLANVDVDMATLEQQQPALAAECEVVYHRDLAREQERVQKVRAAQRNGEDVPRVVPNVPPPNASKTTTETDGPVHLGQEVPDVRPSLFPLTPRRAPYPSEWSTTPNGGSVPLTNGSAVPSRAPHEDSEMLDSQPELCENPEQSQHHDDQQSGGTQGPLSQRGAHTRLTQGSQLEQYHNSASTTTSGQKTSSKDRSSGPYSLNTQLSNGVRPGDHPDFSMLPEARGGSQLPDTQEQPYSSQSQSASQSSQPMGPPQPPHPRQGSIGALLNDPTDGGSGAPPPPQRIFLDQDNLQALHSELVHRSSGLSVEQLEQVHASMMAAIWTYRRNWNRNKVLHAVKDAFNETVKDIEDCQAVMGPSQDTTL